ncbi:hypothetical protein N1851_030427 [Merluccius polli]|uniref:Reverse transcriptase n=1 Tax=Merluccius polli TaxID=89951 RepID=A0AA47M5H5_MERPO|nr:hypothetical protein N1851_030427 [Merluccius polli]
MPDGQSVPATETVSAYINFCEDLVIPKKINFYFSGDETRCRELQKQVKKKLAELNYKDRVETLLSTGNSRPAWEGVKSLMGTQSKKCPISFAGKTDSELANDLNIFYNRFNTYDFSHGTQNGMCVDRDEVCKVSRGVKERNSPGPDNIGGRLLKNCAEPLSDIFSFIFTTSLQLQRVPCLWEDSVIVPVPKIKTPKSLNDYRPVALTPLVMKTFEKIIKEEILGVSQTKLDPL